MANFTMKYPIIAFSQPPDIDICGTEEELTHCSKPALSNGFYRNLKVVDSTGGCFIIKNATKIGTVGPLWGFDLFKGQRLRVKLEFEEKTSQVHTDEFKKKILNVFKADEYFWNSGGNLDKLKEKVAATASIEEIIKFLDATMNTEFK